MLRRSLQKNITDFIQEYIVNNSLKPNDKLPSQKQLAEIMGVSISSLREAVKTLEGQNVLQVVNGKGIYVADGLPSTISTQLEFTEEKESILELLEARRIMEHAIIHLVIQNASEEELEEVAAVLDVLMDRYNKNKPQQEVDRQFHFLYYRYCHNRVMQQLMESIDNLLSKLWDSPLNMSNPFTSTIPLHKELFNATKERNAERAQSINSQIIDMDVNEVINAKFKKE